MKAISYPDIQDAIARCLQAEPPEGLERRLSHEASLLCEILGEMIYAGTSQVDLGKLGQEHLNALARWGSEAVRAHILQLPGS